MTDVSEMERVKFVMKGGVVDAQRRDQPLVGVGSIFLLEADRHVIPGRGKAASPE